MFECVTSKVVSSANNKAKNFEESCRSLIYKIKSRGPKMEPCGTPNVMFSSVQHVYVYPIILCILLSCVSYNLVYPIIMCILLSCGME